MAVIAIDPLLFVCSNLNSNVCSSDLEAQILLEQVNNLIGRHWPRQFWGKYDIGKIAIITATRPQVYIQVHLIRIQCYTSDQYNIVIFSLLQLVVTRKLCRTHFKKFQKVQLLPCYDIQGFSKYY